MFHLVLVAACIVSSSRLLADEYPASRISAQLMEARQPVEVDLAGMKPGEHREVRYLGRPIWIYRRTREDMEYLASGKQDDLANPNDANLPAIIEDQYKSSIDEPWVRLLMVLEPKLVQNKDRSATSDYLVVLANSPLGCMISYQPPGNRPRPYALFLDVCAGTWFDVAGRVLKSNWTPPPMRAKELAGANLLIPPYYFKSPTRLMIGVVPSQDIPQVDFAAVRARAYARLPLQDRLVYAARYNDADELQRGILALGKAPGAPIPPQVLDGAILGGSMNMIELLLRKGVRPTESSREIATLARRPEIIKLIDQFVDAR